LMPGLCEAPMTLRVLRNEAGPRGEVAAATSTRPVRRGRPGPPGAPGTRVGRGRLKRRYRGPSVRDCAATRAGPRSPPPARAGERHDSGPDLVFFLGLGFFGRGWRRTWRRWRWPAGRNRRRGGGACWDSRFSPGGRPARPPATINAAQGQKCFHQPVSSPRSCFVNRGRCSARFGTCFNIPVSVDLLGRSIARPDYCF